MSCIYQEINQALQEEKQFCIITLIKIKGSAPQNIGAKMLVSPTGYLSGTIGGGKIENHCIEYAKKEFFSLQACTHTKMWNLQKDIGMTCGGEVEFLFEFVKSQSKWNIALFGAGHIVQALCPLLILLDVQIFVIDNRKA